MGTVAPVLALLHVLFQHSHIDKPVDRGLYRGTRATELLGHLHLASPAPAVLVGMLSEEA
ncbi:hypothetical protein YH62_19325 [Rhizobium sp. LC145]|nr:hypothetical protein YH62_19325 [Rhizobium sp. LC145]